MATDFHGRLPMHASPLALQRALSRRLLPLAYALAVLVVVILALTWLALQAQVSLAGFLNGESVWSKAQKEAVIQLDAYAETGEIQYYRGFVSNYAILLNDIQGREAATARTVDRQKLQMAFDRGDVMRSAEGGVAFMIRHLAWAPFIRPALRSWRASDRLVVELAQVAHRLRGMYASGVPDPVAVGTLRHRVRDIDQAIAPMSADTSRQMAIGAEWFGRVLFLSVSVAAFLACWLWLWMARRVLAGIRGSEERYRLLFDSAPDAIVMVDEATGRILDANRVAGLWTAREPDALWGTPYADLFAPVGTGGAMGADASLRGRGGSTRPVETQTSLTMWGERPIRQALIRDISERVRSERDRRVAAEALANITEGVIIADAERRVTWMNASAIALTGFSTQDLAGKTLGSHCTMPDGGPLPDSVWEQVLATHHWSGEVQSTRADGSVYAEHLGINLLCGADQRVLHYVTVFSDVSVANANRRRLECLATHDALTGLANRAEFQRHCDVAITRATPAYPAVAVLFIDLDAFKFVNDSYGHAVGDELLRLVAKRIANQLREGDVAGRIGGDEFTVLLPGLALREDATTPARRLLDALAKPFHVGGYEIVLSASVGIASHPLDGTDAAALIANADAAMYVAKNEERNTLRFYAPDMQADAGRRMLLAGELRKALREHEFVLLYQPSVDLKSGRTVGVEALIRWQHPERGTVMPGEFIPVAESIGLIHLIDVWVMNEACVQIQQWDRLGMPKIRVAVNVSARWFGHPGFIDSVRRALQRYAISADRIVLEVTEGAMLHLGEKIEATMRELHTLGIDVSIDDFGTGYASMAYLKLPAVAYLKIDGSFVSGLPHSTDDGAITGAIVAMAKSLGLTTIAECIENEAQHEFLLRAGCVEGQGYLYAHPLAPAALETLLLPRRYPAGAKLRLVPQRHG